jgi:hypothetical protein
MARGSGSREVYNLISVFFLALSGFACVIALLIAGDVVPAGPFEPATEVPTEESLLVNGQLPTATPSNTPRPTDDAPATNTPTPSLTWTPFPTNTATRTPTATNTDIPTATLTFTPTPTLTETPTATVTPSVTFTIPPATNTQAPPTQGPAQILFSVQPNMPIYRDAFLHDGCEWFGAGGQITGSNGEPLIGLSVRISSPSGTVTQITGTNTSYGASGWEAQLGTTPQAGTYTIQVVSADLVTPLSNPVTLSFDGSCERNLALVNFVQTGTLSQ